MSPVEASEPLDTTNITLLYLYTVDIFEGESGNSSAEVSLHNVGQHARIQTTNHMLISLMT